MHKTAFALSMLLATAAIQAQDFGPSIPGDGRSSGESMQKIGFWGGYPHCVEVDYPLVYCGVTDELLIYNLADPYNPIEIGRTGSLGGDVLDIELKDSIAWVATRGGGIVGIGISDPSSPASLYSFLDGRDTRSISIQDSKAFVADYEDGVVLFDIQNPDFPVRVSTFPTDTPDTVIAVDSTVFCSSEESEYYSVVSFQNITQPALQNQVLSPDHIRSIDIEGNLLAAACGEGGIALYNISDIQYNTQVGTLDTDGYAHDILLNGYEAYVADGMEGVVGVDIYDPQNPYLAGGMFSATYPMITIGHSPEVLVAIEEQMGFSAFEYPNAFDLFPSSQIFFNHEVKDLQVNGEYLYVSAGTDGFYVFDTYNPSDTTPVAEGESLEQWSWTLGSISVEGDTAWSVQPSGDRTKIARVDISNPLAPIETHRLVYICVYSYERRPHHTYGQGVITAYGPRVIKVDPDGSDYTDVQYTYDDFVNGLDVHGNLLYLAMDWSGLEIYDISMFTMPELVGSLPMWWSNDVLVENRYAYVMNYTNTIVIADVHKPARPVELGSLTFDSKILDYTVIGRMLFVLTDDDVLSVHEISNPRHPRLIDSMIMELPSVAVTANTNNAWVALLNHGMVSLELPASWNDCNDNGIPDQQDIADGTSEDCNVTGIPDECELPSDIVLDCNENGIWDDCDLTEGSSEDEDYNGIPDECEATSRILFVDDDAPAGGDGHSWQTAFRYLQDALIVASTNDQVWVATGTYKPTDTETAQFASSDRTIAFQLRDNISLYGGFDGTEDPSNPWAVTDRKIQDNPTILCGDLEGNDSENPGSTLDNSNHIVIASHIENEARLDGFIIRGGRTDYQQQGHVTLAKDLHGGAGVLVFYSDSVTIENCVIHSNKSRIGSGVGLFNSSNILLASSIIHDNFSQDAGGGIYVYETMNQIANCLIHKNSTEMFGGGMLLTTNSACSVINSTIVSNQASGDDVLEHGGGICSSTSELNMYNTIIAGNEAHNFPDITVTNSVLTASNCNVLTEQLTGSGNISEDPRFSDLQLNDYRLLPASPCIDAGDSTIVPDWLDYDLANEFRITGTSVDMGAYEYQPGPLAGDADQDGDVDLVDFAAFQSCFQTSHKPCVESFDLDADEDIDLDDFLIFESQITGTVSS